VTNVDAVIPMLPGEYRVYTDIKLDQPEITDAPVSLDEIIHDETTLTIYPNPTSDRVKINYIGRSDGAALIQIIDENGKEVWSKKSLCFIGENMEEFNSENLPSGVYSVIIQQGNFYQTARLNVVK
jgi:hypothetical protein